MDFSVPGSPVLHYLPVCSNSYPLSWWYYLTISSLPPAFHFAFTPSQHQGLFRISFSHSGGQSIGASASASILPMNIKGSNRKELGLAGLISLQSKGLSRVFFSTRILKASNLQCTVFFMAQLSHLYMTTGKAIALTVWTFARKVISLLFNTLSRFVIAFL